MIKLFVQLNGGLGNQLFQYAIGRALALRNNAELVLDIVGGFTRDFQYKRKYELGRFSSLEFDIATRWQQAVPFCYRMKNKLWMNSSCFYQRHFFIDFYVEKKFIFHQALASRAINRNTWLLGYWQSPKYFTLYAALLQRELMPQQPVGDNYGALAALMLQSDSVALGIRLYEESHNPGDHALTGKLKTAVEINVAVEKLRKLKPQGRFFVFCTHRAPELAKLNLPHNTIYVTPDDGYTDSVSSLWLLTRCKHHIFTNSSFYWWGAWLSHAVHNPAEQLIFAADNFINVDGLCEHWGTF